MSHNEYFRRKFEEECKKTRDALGPEFEDLDLGFVSIGFLDEVFKSGYPSKLRKSLQEDVERLKSEDLFGPADMDALELAVRTRAPKLYGILLMINQSERIIKLLTKDPKIDDSIFETSPGSKLSYCLEARLSEEPLLRDIAAEIYEMQWLVPPRFNSERHENFLCALFRFPFVGGAPAHKDSGSWGVVYRAKIADRHLPPSLNVQQHNVVACKSIKKEDNTTWNKLLREAATLKERKHDHIVPLLASFTAGRANREPHNRQEYLWLLMPYAQAGSMETWLEKSPDLPKRGSVGLGDDSFRHCHVRGTMLGLVSALAYIHREINGMIGFHHDIKPSNIILFLEPEPTWKICDFGTANLKDPKEGTGTAFTPENAFGTYTYRPPEYFKDEGIAQHGRAFDVYSLGCVMLELATVFTYGWKPEGLPTFRQQRRDASEYVYHGNLKPEKDESFHNNPKAVESWIEHLRSKTESAEDPKKVSDIIQVLDVIGEMLLSRYKRIFAWEVEMDLYEIFNPNASVGDRAKRLRNIVQPSATPLDQTKEQHNPMRRAILHSKGQWYTEILQGRDWYYSARSLSRRSTSRAFDLDHGKRRPRTNLEKVAKTRDFRSAHFFGRHNIHEKIISGFQGHNTVIGLYGKSGVGKSHSAYYYAFGFQKPRDPKDQKHTLWVDCTSWTSIYKSLQDTIPSEFDNPSILSSVSDWLRNEETGPWIMVLDALESIAIAQKLNEVLPIANGEILITTKNKIILTEFLNVNNKDGFIHMEDLPLLTASYIFDSHINRDLITNTDSRNFVVERLPLPALIISMADHMNRTDYTTQNLQEDECSGANHTIEKRYSDFSERLLSPLFPSSGESKVTRNLDLLGEMSCLDASSIDFALLRQVHTKPDKLQSQLSALEQCSLISTKENRVYTMQQYVQVAVLQWFQVQLGDERLLQLFATALCMLYKRYDDETQERYKQVKGKSRIPSRHWKLPYKPHFDRFLEFARKNKNKARAQEFASYNIKGIDVMVTAIVTFSKLYLEEHRYDDAICVLEFVDDIYTGCERRYELRRLLIRAYLETPLRDEYNDKWSRIAKLSAELINDAERSKNIERKWALVLDLARFYTESHQPEKALRELRGVWEFKMNVEHGEVKLDIYLELQLDKIKKRKLAVQRKIEEGRVHFMNGRLRLHQGLREAAAKETKKAIKFWEDASQGMISWELDHDGEWAMEIEEMIAEACVEIDKPAELDKAETILKRHLIRLKQVPDHEGAEHAAKRIWDIECKQANVWIKRNDKKHREDAIKLLKDRLEKYKDIYGRQDACTRNCAYLLQSALKKDDQDEEIRLLEQQYQLREVSAVRVPTVKRTGKYLSLSSQPWWSVVLIVLITQRLLQVLLNRW
ncbi:unnamed protein product [Alternaria alternata]